jgi:ABC-type transport system substrate-binding protein
MFGYDTSMDWDDDLGSGLNEWYLQQGRLIMPPYSEERVEHYWDWQQHLMDNILPCQPAICPIRYIATWSNLQGYNYEEGLLASWGNMSWDDLHHGQENLNEIVIPGSDWQVLNPIFASDIETRIIPYIFDPVYLHDYSQNYYPHLATAIELLNDTHVRIHIREGVRWHEDPDGLFPNEYLDVDDFYFSFYSMKNIDPLGEYYYFWIDDMKKVDQYTLDIFIDSNQSTIENEPFAPFFEGLQIYILPEHYLNQSQLPDGVTPDIYHSSWNRFATDGFGTGLFQLEDHDEGVQTTLSVVSESWYLDPLVNKSDIDFEIRFGDFSGGLDTLKIRVITQDISAMTEFELGKIDLCYLDRLLHKKEQYEQNPDFSLYSRIKFSFDFFGYNMRESRPHIGNRTACPGNPDLTIGLAVRKAISYAIDMHEINEVLFRGEHIIVDHPIPVRFGKWCNPNIIRYNHDLDTAREYMKIAGYYDEPLETGLSPWEKAGLVIGSVFIAAVVSYSFYRLNKKYRK